VRRCHPSVILSWKERPALMPKFRTCGESRVASESCRSAADCWQLRSRHNGDATMTFFRFLVTLLLTFSSSVTNEVTSWILEAPASPPYWRSRSRPEGRHARRDSAQQHSLNIRKKSAGAWNFSSSRFSLRSVSVPSSDGGFFDSLRNETISASASTSLAASGHLEEAETIETKDSNLLDLIMEKQREVKGRLGTRTRHKNSLSGSTLGDIMSSGLLTAVDGRSTGGSVDTKEEQSSSTTSTLAARYGITHPLDRMALTANGNLQRLVSSYYDSPVEVVVDKCVKREPAEDANDDDDVENQVTAIWDRVVRLRVFDSVTFCTATSVITVHDELCRDLVEWGTVGLGQLFRFLDVLPEFTLLDAGKSKDEGGGFWREYRLDCRELSCHIHEEFCPGMWQLEPNSDVKAIGVTRRSID